MRNGVGKHLLEKLLQSGKTSRLDFGDVGDLDQNKWVEVHLDFWNFYINYFLLSAIFLKSRKSQHRNVWMVRLRTFFYGLIVDLEYFAFIPGSLIGSINVSQKILNQVEKRKRFSRFLAYVWIRRSESSKQLNIEALLHTCLGDFKESLESFVAPQVLEFG